jgi:NAD(P)-dependent dehydrogenase (short-subunit alcohol dehydrogenase family)
MNRILITGSTDGIGKEAAIILAKSGEHVIVHGRNKKKAIATVNEIKKACSPENVSYVIADFSSMNQIREMAQNIQETFSNIDVLVNNAGVYNTNRKETKDGFEETLAVNYLAPFYLTNLLIDLLKVKPNSRIVNVVSEVHSNHLDLDNLQFKTGYTGVKAYANSKTCLIMFTYVLAEALQSTNVDVICMHPGVINTKLLEAAMGSTGYPISYGAERLVHAAISPDLTDISGIYLVNNVASKSKDITYNTELQYHLWKKTEDLIGVKY